MFTYKDLMNPELPRRVLAPMLQDLQRRKARKWLEGESPKIEGEKKSFLVREVRNDWGRRKET